MVISPQTPADGKWNSFTEPKPYVSVSGFAYDSTGRFPILWRSDKVRSAKNCWSLPSGLHEVGLTFQEQFATELKEELGLEPILSTGKILGVYENIAVVDNWHWCIAVLAMRVETLDTLVNKEPDKHSKIDFLTVFDLQYPLRKIYSMTWGPHLKEAILAHRLEAFWNISFQLKTV